MSKRVEEEVKTASPRQLHILQHSLGVDQHGQGERYRNHFVTGEGSVDYLDCMALVDAGLMERRGYSALTGGDWCFTVTEAGGAYVTEHSPPPPKLTAGQRRYREWLDVCDVTQETFIEFCRRKASPNRSTDSGGIEGGE